MADGSGGGVERTTLAPEHLSQLLSASLELMRASNPRPSSYPHPVSLPLNWGSPINLGTHWEPSKKGKWTHSRFYGAIEPIEQLYPNGDKEMPQG